MPVFSDLADLPEDERIRVIGELAEQGQQIAFIVDSDEAADRYVNKLLAQYRVRVLGRVSGPVKNTLTITVTRRFDS